MGCMGGSIEVPGPTPQQIQLQNMQLAQAAQASAYQQALMPYTLQSMGLKEAAPGVQDLMTKEADARMKAQMFPNDAAAWTNLADYYKKQLPEGITSPYVKMTEEEQLAGMTPQEQLQYQNTKLQQERLNQALQGNLPVDPALERDLQLQEAQMKEQLVRDLGPNAMESTAGMQRMGEFQKRADLMRESARRGEISTGTGLALNQMGYMGTNTQNKIANYASPGNQSMGYAQSYATQQQPYTQQQQMGLQANIAQAQQQTAMMQGLGSLLGTAGGIGASKWLLA
jgi:hypothetical protein